MADHKINQNNDNQQHIEIKTVSHSICDDPTPSPAEKDE